MTSASPALESTADLGLRDRYGLFIGGTWIAPADGGYAVTENPATESALALVARATDVDVERAVRAARRAYDKYWRKLKPTERAKYVFRIARALAEGTRAFATCESLDCGVPIRHARDVLAATSAQAFYDAGWADKLAFAIGAHERAHPFGVVGALVSSRSPLASALEILAPALACGNAVVLKPATATPLSALVLARACQEIDLPPGVINVVSGDAATGAALVEHADLDLVAFEGCSAVAKSIRRALAGGRTRNRFQLDGAASIVVFDDAPLDAAVENIVAATYRTGTRASLSGTLVLVAESIAYDVLERVTARLSKLRCGDPLDRNTDVGALPSKMYRDALAMRIDRAVAAGATLVGAPWTAPERGYFRPPTLLTDLPASFDLATDDAVGPCVALATFRTPGEAIERANAVTGAVSASVWTSGGALALWAAQRLFAGVVWCNTFHRFDPSSPFGGVGASAAGRVGGLVGLRAYLDL